MVLLSILSAVRSQSDFWCQRLHFLLAQAAYSRPTERFPSIPPLRHRAFLQPSLNEFLIGGDLLARQSQRRAMLKFMSFNAGVKFELPLVPRSLFIFALLRLFVYLSLFIRSIDGFKLPA